MILKIVTTLSSNIVYTGCTLGSHIYAISDLFIYLCVSVCVCQKVRILETIRKKK